MIIGVAVGEVDADNICPCPNHSCYNFHIERRWPQRAADLHTIEVRVIFVSTLDALLDELLKVREIVLSDLIGCKLIVKRGHPPNF